MSTQNKKTSAPSTPKRVALGMSGGVDSSLAAHLLVEQGYDVTGVFLECWRAPGCRSEEDRKDALAVALSLNIPFVVLDFKQAYRDRVVQYFFDEYKSGKTPNPDVLCNREIKFGLFYDWAMEQGFNLVATGHYAKIAKKDGKPALAIPKDTAKDQTYFLHLLRAEQLASIHFPLGELTKAEVRTEAEKRGIHVAKKKDSVGICFIGDINVHDFLRDELGENPGKVVDSKGTVIGTHQGLWFYTIGQRHGFDIDKHTVVAHADGSTSLKQNFPPYYVIAKQAEKNQLVVGFGSETERSELLIEHMHWIQQPDLELPLMVRIRHTGQLLPSLVSERGKQLSVKLLTPTKGIAEGQSAVVYQIRANKHVICLGGGIMSLHQTKLRDS